MHFLYNELDLCDQVSKLCMNLGLKLHLDGTRLLHVAYATNFSPSTLAEVADSVTLCLNKGLDAANGSLIAGNREFINRYTMEWPVSETVVQ